MIATQKTLDDLLANRERVIRLQHRRRRHPIRKIGEYFEHFVAEGEVEIVEGGFGGGADAVGVQNPVDVGREGHRGPVLEP
ncbi:MAG TPA: hypothetical protein VGQ76_00515 [Thermoanaerobaculia bacterium]|jgi:hypothetical protein|nr:hypothetical protein [Thermoanaerobaculia bacterium]